MNKWKNWLFAQAFLLFIVEAAQADTVSTADDKPPVITPQVSPYVIDGVNIFTTVDFIFWEGGQDNLAYAQTANRIQREVPVTSKGKEHFPKSKFNPGFKVGLGTFLPHDGWDIYARYTWLHSSAHDSFNDPTGNVSVNMNTGSRVANIRGPTSGSIAWKMHFNVVDLELGRTFYISPRLKLRPHMGLKGTWQDIDFTVTFKLTDPAPDESLFRIAGTNVTGPVVFKDMDDIWGIGARSGLDTSFQFFRHLSLVGNFAFTGLYNHYETKSLGLWKNSDDNTTNIATSIHENGDNLKVNFISELQLGLRGDFWPISNHYHLAAELLYESQVWVNFAKNEVSVVNDLQFGDLFLHGLTAKLRFDF